MPEDQKITVTSAVTFRGEGSGAGQRRATVTIEASGPVTATAKTYEWSGVDDAAGVLVVADRARWAFGRQMYTTIRKQPHAVSGHDEGGGWQTKVEWPRLTVSLNGFTSLDEAIMEARDAVAKVVDGLVPTAEQRETGIRAMTNIRGDENWWTEVYRSASAYP